MSQSQMPTSYQNPYGGSQISKQQHQEQYQKLNEILSGQEADQQQNSSNQETMTAPATSNSYLQASFKTQQEREATKKTIIKKHKHHILSPQELKTYQQANEKVLGLRMMSNLVMFGTLVAFIRMRHGDNHARRLTMFKFLLLNMGFVGAEMYYITPLKQLQDSYSLKYLSHLTDNQLDQVLKNGGFTDKKKQENL